MNGDFSNGINGWSVTNLNTNAVVAVSSNSLSMTNWAGNASTDLILYQSGIALDAGSYTLSFKAGTEASQTRNLIYEIAATSQVYCNTGLILTPVLTQYSCSFDVINPTTGSVRFLAGAGWAQVILDDVSLIRSGVSSSSGAASSSSVGTSSSTILLSSSLVGTSSSAVLVSSSSMVASSSSVSYSRPSALVEHLTVPGSGVMVKRRNGTVVRAGVAMTGSTIRLIDTQGRVMVQMQALEGTAWMDLSHFRAGLYVLQVSPQRKKPVSTLFPNF